jgi:hypothetical protein
VSLADRIAEHSDAVNGTPCSVAGLIAEAEARGELHVLQRMMYGRAGLTEPAPGLRGMSERKVFEIVTGEFYKVAKNQINEHRGKRCRCYRDAR